MFAETLPCLGKRAIWAVTSPWMALGKLFELLRQLSMPPYQNRFRFATSKRFFRLLWRLFPALVFLWCLGLGSGAGLEAAGAPAPGSQALPTDPAHLLLLPGDDGQVELLTHIAELDLTPKNGRLQVTVQAQYRLHNPGVEGVTLPLVVRPAADFPSAPLPTNISLTVDGQPLTLQPSADGRQWTSQLAFSPDARRKLTLGYQFSLETPLLATIRYPIHQLRRWPKAVNSWRVTVRVPSQAPAESWLQMAPDGWKLRTNAIEWLGETTLPTQPVLFQFLDPAVWQAIQSAQQTAQADPSPAGYARLGDLYRQIAASPLAGEEVRERFYAQALAAYEEGLQTAEERDASPEKRASLHAGLAALYRSRSVDSSGRVDPEYLSLMLAEVEQALAGLTRSEQASRRQELTRWLAEGLRVQLGQVQERRDWQAALQILDRMAALPPELADPQELAQERQILLLQQALQLLEQGNVEAAVALAGPEIALDDLGPPPEQRTLFARWQVSLILEPEQTRYEFQIQPGPGQEEAAGATLAQLSQAWQQSGVPHQLENLPGQEGFRLAFTLGSQEQRRSLVQATPPIVHWSLLRTLLLQPGPEVQRQARLIWETVTLEQTMDLRSVGDQWLATAANLERQAEQFLADQPAGTEGQVGPEALRSRLQAIAFRNEAAVWRGLATNSHVLVTLRIPGGEEGVSRTWSVGLLDPPQAMQIQAQRVMTLRLWLAVVTGIVLVLGLAGLLWWLL